MRQAESSASATLLVKEAARQLGFDRVGVARALPLDEDHARYLAFLAAGRHGDMGWLARHVEVRRRVDTPAILAGAASVVVCALGYPDDGADAGPPGARIARYARGEDYHVFLRALLRELAGFVQQRLGGRARAVVDTAPVLERAWAARAGVGFVGRHGCIIAPGLGSYLLLGEVLTTVPLAPDAPLRPRCGRCTRCLEACPTQALVAPYELDARRCLAYLTIEHRGAVPEPFRAAVGDRLFGCDACQEACPYQRARAAPGAHATRFALDPRWRAATLGSLLTSTDDAHAALVRGLALDRTDAATLARNAALVLGNVGGPADLPALQAVAAQGFDEVRKEAARWAVARILGRSRDEPGRARTDADDPTARG